MLSRFLGKYLLTRPRAIQSNFILNRHLCSDMGNGGLGHERCAFWRLLFPNVHVCSHITVLTKYPSQEHFQSWQHTYMEVLHDQQSSHEGCHELRLLGELSVNEASSTIRILRCYSQTAWHALYSAQVRRWLEVTLGKQISLYPI